MSFHILQAKPGGHQSPHHSKAFRWVVHLGIPGLFAVSILDASVIPLAIPGSTDLLLLWLIAHGRNPVELVAVAVVGSMIGGYTTWHLGRKGGEAALKRYVSPRLQKRVQGWSEEHPILAVLVPAILPPPIPLWPFLLAAGALGATLKRFLAAFGGGRLIRYGLVGWLAAKYGRHMVRIWSAELDKWSAPIGWTFGALTVLGLAYGIWKFKHANATAKNDTGTAGQPQASEAD